MIIPDSVGLNGCFVPPHICGSLKTRAMQGVRARQLRILMTQDIQFGRFRRLDNGVINGHKI